MSKIENLKALMEAHQRAFDSGLQVDEQQARERLAHECLQQLPALLAVAKAALAIKRSWLGGMMPRAYQVENLCEELARLEQ